MKFVNRLTNVYGVEIWYYGNYSCTALFESREDAEDCIISTAREAIEENDVPKENLLIVDTDAGLDSITDIVNDTFCVQIQEMTITPKKEN